MANRFFTMMPRNVSIQYFNDNPITVNLRIGDENDAKMRTALTDTDKKAVGSIAKHREIFESMVGESNADQILKRLDDLDEVDCYAITTLIAYTARSYLETRQKNLNAAAAGTLR